VPKRLTEVEYDQKIAVYGKALRIESYKNTRTKILHKCLIHGTYSLAIPMNLIAGQGLNCCGASNLSRIIARDMYDEKIKKFGRVIRVGEYINAYEKILHECLEHGQIHMAKPHNILNGSGLACCKNPLTDSIKELILKEQNTNNSKYIDTCVYIFKMSNYPDHLKLGISKKIHDRSRDPEYGEFISSWHTNSRLEAYCVEQASLHDCLLPSSCPEKLRSINWPGYTEIILCSEQTAIDVVQYYWDLVQELGPYQFILNYLNPTEDEQKLCLKALSAPNPLQTVLQ